jgi:hypothetical protein
LQGAVYIKSQGLWTGLDHRRILFNLFWICISGGVKVRDYGRALITGAFFSNAEVAVEVKGNAEAACEESRVSGCAAALLVCDKAKALMDGCDIACTKVGAAFHGPCSVVISQNNFSRCRDGALYSGGCNMFQTVDFCNNTVLCTPPKDTHSGYTWLRWLCSDCVALIIIELYTRNFF